MVRVLNLELRRVTQANIDEMTILGGWQGTRGLLGGASNTYFNRLGEEYENKKGIPGNTLKSIEFSTRKDL